VRNILVGLYFVCVLRAFAFSRKGQLDSSCFSVLLFARIGAAPTGQISVKFGIGNFFERLSRRSKFGCRQKY
jgi:hypothetical protein